MIEFICIFVFTKGQISVLRFEDRLMENFLVFMTAFVYCRKEKLLYIFPLKILFINVTYTQNIQTVYKTSTFYTKYLQYIQNFGFGSIEERKKLRS